MEAHGVTNQEASHPTTAPSRMTVTIVRAPGCRLCDEAEDTVRDLAECFPVDLRRVEMTSREGLALLAAYRPTTNPLVLVDDVLFSVGRLPRDRLTALLRKGAKSAVGALG